MALIAAATTHSAGLAQSAISDLNKAVVQAANGIERLKAAGVR